ncbi:hypothetical protein ACP4OV_009033 [Aristida adscensionis]
MPVMRKRHSLGVPDPALLLLMMLLIVITSLVPLALCANAIVDIPCKYDPPDRCGASPTYAPSPCDSPENCLRMAIDPNAPSPVPGG